MAQGFVQHRDVPAQAAEHLHVALGVLHLYLHHVMDEVLIAGPLRTAEQQLHRLPVGADIVHHPVHTSTGLQAHVLRLLLFRQLGKGSLCFHKAAHEGRGVGLHDGVEQGLLAGKVAVKGPSGHPGVLYNLPQGGSQKSLVQKFRQSRLLNFFQCSSGPLLHSNFTAL